MASIAVHISEEVLNDGAALSAFLKKQFKEGYRTVELRLMPTGAKWHEEDAEIPIGGRPSEAPEL